MLGSIERKLLSMSIQRTVKQSDLEKRLKLLHRQVYGRPSSDTPAHRPTTTLTYRNADIPTQHSTIFTASDVAFLRQDLLKILLFSSLAIGIQIVLFFLMKNNILTINLI